MRTRSWIVAIALVVVATSSCSARQVQAWFAVHQGRTLSPTEAQAVANQVNAVQPAGCDDNYTGGCVPDNVLAVHCVGEGGEGPAVTGPFTVVGWDHFGLDRDADKVACEVQVPIAPAFVPPAPGDASRAVDPNWRNSMLDRINGERGAVGLGGLQACPRLDRSAQAHSEDQAARSLMTHTGSDGSGPGDRAARVGYTGWVGENIAAGYVDVTSVMDGWMSSGAHRANVLGGYAHLGLGRAVSGSGQVYWTQDFGVGGTC